MARLRRKQLQQFLPLPDPNRDPRGGKRAGAGRPAKGKRSSARHKRRPKHDHRHPVHVTVRVVDGLGTLRQRDAYLAIREATFTAFTREVFRLVHFSIQSNHIHLIAEAANKKALSRGMQGFQISAAKRLNAAITKRTGSRRRGQVFTDRYHARALSTPRAVRHALCYVLNNWRRHREDRAVRTRTWKVDPFSNGWEFFGWKERALSPLVYQPSTEYLAMSLVTWFPKTWLLRDGWQRHGLISIREVPGPETASV